jgi:hypothetical protein
MATTGIYGREESEIKESSLSSSDPGEHKAVQGFLQGTEPGFCNLRSDIAVVQNWKKDRSTPLPQVMDGWKIFTSHQ